VLIAIDKLVVFHPNSFGPRVFPTGFGNMSIDRTRKALYESAN